MSLCDTCSRPGRCCSGFLLNGGEFGRYLTRLELMARLATAWHDYGVSGLGLPFLPLYDNCHGVWRFWCPNLTREGRCGDYENRPKTCRSFEPASDPLCAYWKPLAPKCDGCTDLVGAFARDVKVKEDQCQNISTELA